MKKMAAKEQSWEEIGKAVGAKIEKESKDGGFKDWNIKGHLCGHGGGGAVYGLGLIGALAYYLTTATGFWMGFIGILKSIVWPAYFVYGALKFLGM